MTTSVAEAVSRPVSGKYDRAFYSSMAIGMALTVLVGFGPTCYMKPFSHTPMTTLSGGPMTPAERGQHRTDSLPGVENHTSTAKRIQCGSNRAALKLEETELL